MAVMADVPHEKSPDDFMVVTISLEFRAKRKKGGRPVDVPVEWTWTTSAGDGDLGSVLEKIADAAYDGRLFGLLQELCAENAILADEWQELTLDDLQKTGAAQAGLVGIRARK